MLTVAPVLPDEGVGEQEAGRIVQVKAGAPASATVMSIGTVTVVAALAGPGKTTRGINNVHKASKAILAGFDSSPLPT